MNSPKRRKYRSPLRQSQADDTRQRILAAVGRLFEGGQDKGLSVDAVAVEARVERRTVFRHFPTKEALLAAFWSWMNDRIAPRIWPVTEQDLMAMPPVTFEGFDRHENIIRAALLSRSGHELRLRANAERQAAFRMSLAAATKGLDPNRAEQAAAVLQLLYSANAWLSLRDYWFLSGREAGESVSWAIGVLLRELRREAKNSNHPLSSTSEEVSL